MSWLGTPPGVPSNSLISSLFSLNSFMLIINLYALKTIFSHDTIKVSTYFKDEKENLDMKENNLKIAQQDIEDALKAIEDMEKVIDSNSLEKEMLKAKFVTLTEKVQKVEEILKSEGIL